MRRNKKIMFLTALLTAAICLSCFILVGCAEDKPAEQLNFASALKSTSEKEVLGINTSLKTTFAFYDNTGAPMRISNTFSLYRATDGERVFLEGKISTDEFKLSASLNLAIMTFVAAFGYSDVAEFLNGKKTLVLQAGITEDAINARADVIGEGEQADFVYSFNDTDEQGNKIKVPANVFFGAATDDVDKFVEDLDFDQLSSLDYFKEAVKPLLIPEDASALVNQLSDAYSESEQGYRYLFNYESGKLVRGITDFAGEFIEENLEKGRLEEDSLPVKIYNDYLETVKSFFTVSDVKVSASANKNGLLNGTETSFSVDVSIEDSVIKDAAVKLGIVTEEEADTMLEALHAFVRASGGADGLTEMKFIFELKESYVYDVALDGADPIFASVDEDTAGRTVLKYEQVPEGDRYEWNLYGGDFGEAR